MKGSVVLLNLENKKIGFAFTGSFCTFKAVIEELKKLKKEKADPEGRTLCPEGRRPAFGRSRSA